MMSLRACIGAATAAVRQQRPTRLSAAVGTLRNFSDSEGPKKKQTKVKKKSKKVKDDTAGQAKDLALFLSALDAPIIKPPPVDAEEQARRETVLKNYTIGSFKEHNEFNHDMSCKIKLKNHAIKMMPRGSELKKAAMIISDEMPPPWRAPPTWTPPIPGYDPTQYAPV